MINPADIYYETFGGDSQSNIPDVMGCMRLYRTHYTGTRT